ncbi:MAG: hypothetical protein KAH18_07605 [Psychromonas sp.]|nr:hypothetical protein [Psychromonas sp.]
MCWHTLLMGGHWVYYRKQTEKGSCAPTCVEIYLKNNCIGITGRGHVMNSALWSMRAQQHVHKREIKFDHFLRTGMNTATIPHFLLKYSLNSKHIILDSSRDSVQQTINELTHLPVDSGIIYVSDQHASLGLIKENGQAYLDPNPSYDPELLSHWTWLNGAHSDTWYYMGHVRDHSQFKALYLSWVKGETFKQRINQVIIIYPQKRLKQMALSARSSLKNLNQYFDSIFKKK